MTHRPTRRRRQVWHHLKMGGRPDGEVEVVPHRSEWAADFEQTRTALVAAVGDVAISVEHIGRPMRTRGSKLTSRCSRHQSAQPSLRDVSRYPTPRRFLQRATRFSSGSRYSESGHVSPRSATSTASAFNFSRSKIKE